MKRQPEVDAGAERLEGEFEGSGGVPLYFQAWRASHPRVALLVAHGQGEHSGRYAALAQDLVMREISVYALDHRGHGRSPGRRGHVRSFAELTDDLECFREAISRMLPPATPLFLLGHSLGGLIVLRYLQERPDVPLRGAILSSPALDLAFQPPLWKKVAGRVLSLLLPTLRFSNEIDPEHLSRGAEVVARYREDPLVHPWITPRLYTEMMGAMREARRGGERLRMPMLFLVPADDRIVPARTAIAFARELPGPAELHVYQGFYHESFNEPDRHRVVQDLSRWMLAHA